MAVFTSVSLDDLAAWLPQFPLGKGLGIQGISSGIENSNFFIATESGEYVLTVFEKLSFEQLPFYVNLMRHLASRDVLVPEPIANREGKLITPLHGKPATIVTKLAGRCQLAPQPAHCAAVGEMLAKMHLAGQDFSIYQPNLRGLDWWLETAPAVENYLNQDSRTLLHAELEFQQAFTRTDACGLLPRGPIHADLFRNNVMFDEERLTGFFDFYFAGFDAWLFDVAVTVNDWCIDLDTGAIDLPRARAMLNAYHAVRPFTASEQSAWPVMLRAGALRFWLSRLYDFHLPRDAEMLTPHDPVHFERILRQRINQPIPSLT